MERWFPIATERLLLREFSAADESDIHEYGGDTIVARYVDWGPNTPEKTHEILASRLRDQLMWPRDEVDLAVELREEQKVIGSITLWMLDRQTGVAGYGYAFNRAYWNNGYASEASRAILRVAFSTLRLHGVLATCDVRNVGSWRVMEKVGMHRARRLERDVLQKGEWRDSYEYAIISGDIT
ncbi:MAG TPA: GNAT family N-acetyltransferase [Candidatus Tumulicola sp.]|jgi:RimJ/RimL family protein N-acetyltransferase